MAFLPAGTVTFLFTDIQGSTRLLEQHPRAYPAALAHHHTLVRSSVKAHGGSVFETVGDAICAVFSRPSDAVAAALNAQRALQRAQWGEVGQLMVRIALHTGEVEQWGDHYFGAPLYRCARLLATAHGGQVVLSTVTAALVRDALPEGASLLDLGEHRLKDLQGPECVFQLLHLELQADFPPLRTLEGRPHNLPVQPTPLIGREREVDATRQQLRSADMRLLTLTGPGGIGKTRLALQVAAEALEDFSDGAFFVPLGPIRDPHLVVATIAKVIGVRETVGRLLRESLHDYLRDKRLLLVLDNFEQVMTAASQVADVLTACPYLKVLATSRAVLHLRGEQDFPVPSLVLPERGQRSDLSALARCPAVALFIARGKDVKPDFALTEDNAPAVTEICARLDGLPLAIELAAARIRVLSPQAMVRRLERRLPLLTGGARDLPTRQQTLRDTIAWSYDLLGADEQVLFRRLAVFVGGCTLDAAEVVGKDVGQEKAGVLDGVTSLVDESLLRCEETVDGEPRFVMLETIREYAEERLEASGEAAATRWQHAKYFLALAEQAEQELVGPHEVAWFDRLEREHANLRVALEWLVGRNEPGLALRLGAALGRFWRVRGHLAEGRNRLVGLLSPALASERTAVRAKALLGAGWLARDQGDYKPARAMFEESLAIARAVGDRPGILWSLMNLGFLARYEGDYGAARNLHQESLAIAREGGDKVGIAASLGHLGAVARDQSDYAAARPLLEESLNVAREIGDSVGIAWPLGNLGLVAYYQGDYAAARSLIEEALGIWRALADRQNIANSLNNLALVATAQADYASATSFLKDSLGLLREVGDRRGITFVLERLAILAAKQVQPQRCLRLAGAAAALREALGAAPPPAWRAECERALELAWQTLSKETSSAAWEEGERMSLEQVFAFALENAAYERKSTS